MQISAVKRLLFVVSILGLVLIGLSGNRLVADQAGSPSPTPTEFLLVWAGDEDGQDSDFLTIIDADPFSLTYGKILRTVTLPAIPGAHLLAELGMAPDLTSDRLNEPHHISEELTQDRQLFAGGLISANIFRFDLSDPLHIPPPTLLVPATAVKQFAGVDDIHLLSNDHLLVTYMGAKDLTTPGGVVEITPDGIIVGEYSAATDYGPFHYRTFQNTGPLANPHGLDIREDLNLMITSDYADPMSLATSTEVDQRQKLRSTVRLWDLQERRVRRVVQVPDGPRYEENPLHEEPEGLMSVGLLHRPDHRGAFVASMCGGTLYYSPDVTVAEPAFQEVYDFGPCTGASVFAITQDDQRLIIPIAGIQSPGDPVYNPTLHARRVIQLDISRLVQAGASFVCSGENLNAVDCPQPVGEVNLNSELNFATHGGPHVLALDARERRVALSDYFVQLEAFGLPGSGSDGDHRVYLINRVGDQLILDTAFRDENDRGLGVNFNRSRWPHGETGPAKPHGMIFVSQTGR